MSESSIKKKLELVKSRLDTLDRELSEEQLDFILHPANEACFLSACPGSGKTEVVGIKAAYEISNWKDKFRGVAILSFTNNAAKEITDRVRKYGGAKATQHPHFIGTIDSWLHGYILHPFTHKETGYKGRSYDKSYILVENEERYDFLTPFKTIISFPPNYKEVGVNDFYLECTNPIQLQSQSRYLDLTSISDAVKTLLIQNKKKFLQAGLTTYADAEFLCFYLLVKNQGILANLVKRYPIIIIDECQDLSNNQLGILNLLSCSGVIIHFIGDNNQAIYEFKKVYVESINTFIADHKLKLRFLTKNYRSNQRIVNVSLGLEKYNTGINPIPVIGVEKEIANKSCILWEYKDDELLKLPQKFIDYIKNINTTIQDTETEIKISNSVILARAHTTLTRFHNHIMSDLTKTELIANALNCWSNNPRTGMDMQNSLQQIGKAISLLAYKGFGNYQYQFCPEVYNHIEWRNLLCDLILNATETADRVYPFTDLTWSQWTSKLKLFLENYWSNFRPPIENWSFVKSKIKSPNGKATKLMNDTITVNSNSYSEKIRMTTIHDVKGETLDAVLLVSSKDRKSKGGYFEHWLSDAVNEKEFVRFAYVASSRPKHLLIWAIPKIENNQFIKKIIDLGFEIE